MKVGICKNCALSMFIRFIFALSYAGVEAFLILRCRIPVIWEVKRRKGKIRKRVWKI